MDAATLKTIENTFWVMGTVCTILGAWYRFMKATQDGNEKVEALREKYIWQWVQLTKLIHLPERALIRFLKLKEWMAVGFLENMIRWFISPIQLQLEKIINRTEFYDKNWGLAFGLSMIIIIPGAMFIWIHWGWVVALIGYFGVGALWGLEYFYSESTLASAGIGLFSFFASVAILQVSLSMDIWLTTVCLLMLLPGFASLIIFTLMSFTGILTGEAQLPQSIQNFGPACIFSFVITSLALFLGSLIYQDSHLPQTVQMYLVNVICDGVTLVLTFMIIEWALRGRNTKSGDNKINFHIPVAIVLDISIAGLLACVSLYFGLLGSANELTVQQAWNVLWGKAPAGTHYELGPYFWAMHTTFLPTLIYLFVIALAFVGKLIVLPIYQVFREDKALDKPHEITAYAYFFIAAVFMAVANLIGRIAPDQIAG